MLLDGAGGIRLVGTHTIPPILKASRSTCVQSSKLLSILYKANRTFK